MLLSTYDNFYKLTLLLVLLYNVVDSWKARNSHKTCTSLLNDNQSNSNYESINKGNIEGYNKNSIKTSDVLSLQSIRSTLVRQGTVNKLFIISIILLLI